MSQKEQNEQFKELKLSSKLIVIVSIILIVAIALAMIFGGYFFGMKGLFSILGITYDSNQTLVLFILVCFAAGLIIDPLTMIVSMILAKSLSLKKTALFAFILYFISNFITIGFADYFMQSIYIPDVLLFVISALMAFIELAFDDQPNEGTAKNSL
ncbi:regulatory YrvL family protein [Bacillus inaquosorum]|uniref:regulatory YrvL family protein n=1 Tax=Bacillus inaquosorum TaxID=483913 RepID=UPI002282A0A9|nr:regulatory YrvL family protein [Bacillus inaquosorum]MCY7962644.1 regulatory YrvL family protein [Bacillus inaquosorum]MCY8867590.1 regulatory YrvL family protein [Bacillus inaquosorum]MCY9058047.1 regulatory YrvL family protein [Bacillus inaquosorum]MCY9078664.1 regulatory YrvL family protein [Bacillus inaquosorum]